MGIPNELLLMDHLEVGDFLKDFVGRLLPHDTSLEVEQIRSRGYWLLLPCGKSFLANIGKMNGIRE